MPQNHASVPEGEAADLSTLARERVYAHRENLANTQIDLGARARAGELRSASDFEA